MSPLPTVLKVLIACIVAIAIVSVVPPGCEPQPRENAVEPAAAAEQAAGGLIPRDFEIVINHYQEDPRLVHTMITNYTRILRDNHTVEPYIVVLTKNVDPRTVQDRLTLKCTATEERGCANETISLRNVGRETESFLWYINQRYHSLASYTLFTQALSMAPEWVVNRLQNVLQLRGPRRTGFLPLSQTNVSQCGGDWWSKQTYNRAAYTLLTGELCDETADYLVAFRSEFVVSQIGEAQARLLAQPLSTYQKLHSWVKAPSGHFLHDNTTWEGPEIPHEGPDRPYFGYVLERNWALTFNCTDPGVRYSCCEQWDMIGTESCQSRPPGMKGGSVIYPAMQPGDCGCMDYA